MTFPLYLALTAAEFGKISPLPAGCAWMACHFSCYGTGLSNCPTTLPPGSMLILNDRTPPCGHDPELIARQLSQLVQEQNASCVLLDFQRCDDEETAHIAKAVTAAVPCPVGVAEPYAWETDGPVFLPPPPLHQPLESYLQPWDGREIWLEAALDSEQITVTANGSRFSPGGLDPHGQTCFDEETLHCRYWIQLSDTQAVFSLWRTPEHLNTLLTQAQALGVTKVVGLYQELGGNFSFHAK